MEPTTLCDLAGRLLRHPTVPYHEHAVRAEVEAICAENQLTCRRDRFGNLLVGLGKRAGARPLVLAAHMDHPGFEVVRAVEPRTWAVRFRGSVPDRYFRVGTPLRLMPGREAGVLRRGTKGGEFHVTCRVAPRITPRFAVWDLEDFKVRSGRVYARACDDLIGVAAALATLIELKRRGARVSVLAAISRAEEVGFHGALALAASKGLPGDSLVVSLETSRELPGVHMGAGVIVRVGDRTSIFDSVATRYLVEVAAGLAAKRPEFTFQRALMGGGTCEATAYQEFGYTTTAVCVALGNYHNCGPDERIASEYVSVNDVCRMVDLLTSVAQEMPRAALLTGKLPKRMKELARTATRELVRRG